MPPRLFDFLNKPKYQILYFIFRYGQISTRHSRAEIGRAFGYSSSGHFYPDFDDLLDNKLIIEKDGHYQLGSEGKKELRFYSTTVIGLYYAVSFSIIFLWYYYISTRGTEIPNVVFLIIGAFLIVMALFFFITLKSFIPKLPVTTSSLKNRGIISRIQRRISKE